MNKEADVDRKLTEDQRAYVEVFVEARKRFERAELDYMAFLHGAEKTERDRWGPLASSFEAFIRKYVGKPALTRYANYKRAVQELGLEKVEFIGYDAATEELLVEGEAREKLDQAAVLWTKEQGGKHMSDWESERLRKKIVPRPEVPGPVKRFEELEALRAENAELRRQNDELKARLATSEEALSAVRKRLALYETTPPRPGKKEKRNRPTHPSM